MCAISPPIQCKVGKSPADVIVHKHPPFPCPGENASCIDDGHFVSDPAWSLSTQFDMSI